MDLSFNNLTEAIAEDIIRWIDKGVTFGNIYGNAQCSLKNIENLSERMIALTNHDMNEVNRLMRHIVFLPIYYINTAVKKERLYSHLCKLGYLPDDWATVQKSYYLSLSEKLIEEPDFVNLGES